MNSELIETKIVHNIHLGLKYKVIIKRYEQYITVKYIDNDGLIYYTEFVIYREKLFESCINVVKNGPIGDFQNSVLIFFDSTFVLTLEFQGTYQEVIKELKQKLQKLEDEIEDLELN